MGFIIFFIGIVVGSIIGAFAMAMLVAANDHSDDEEQMKWIEGQNKKQ